MSEGLDTVIGGSTIDEGRADACFRQGCDAEAAGDRMGAIQAYREAVDHGGKAEHMHRLAYLLDLMGEEDEAIELYDRSLQQGTPRIQTLVNLGVLYEDRGDYSKAKYVLKQVVDSINAQG